MNEISEPQSVATPIRNESPVPDDQIVERIFAAVIERRLRPGAKLPEGALCDAFGVSRAGVRRIFIKLAERGIVTLQPNRGAFVSSPSPDEAQNVRRAARHRAMRC